MSKSDTPKKKQAKSEESILQSRAAILDVMDSHITSIILNTSIKPAECFRRFLNDNTHGEIIEACKQSILNGENSITEDEIDNKIKKTYKNRYFLIQKKYERAILMIWRWILGTMMNNSKKRKYKNQIKRIE